MSQAEWFTSYFEYASLKDMLKVILYSSQSMFAIVPMLYHIVHNNRNILFIPTGMVGGVVVHYLIQDSMEPDKKFIELNRLSGEFAMVNSIGSDAQSLYVPILELKRSSLHFPE
jgi:hypothetical protein